MLSRRLMVLVMGLAMFGLFGLAGCKNVCEKAADHMKGCMEEYCADHEGEAICEALEEAEGEEAAVPECEGQAKEMAEEMLSKSCDEIFGGGE